MTFGPAKDHNYMHMLREARDQKYNNDVVIATDRKKRRMPIFPPIISQIGSYHHHAFLVRRWRHWVGWHDLGMSRIPQLDFLSAKYPAVSLVGHVVSYLSYVIMHLRFREKLKSIERNVAFLVEFCVVTRNFSLILG